VEIRQAIIALAFIVVFIPSVHAAATIADIYSAPSEAEKFARGSTSPVDCQDLSTLCDDSEFDEVVDEYTSIGDGSTTSGVSIRNNIMLASGYLRLVYDVDGLVPGNYYLRFAKSTTGSFPYIICGYQNHTAVNISRCETGVTVDEVWNEIDVTSFVNRQFDEFGARVTLRLIVNSSSAQKITEVYLKRPIKPEDISIVAQGVSEAEANTRIENTWAIISQTALPAIENTTCTLHRLNDINDTESEYVINFSQLNPEIVIGPSNEYFKVYWDSNTSVDGVSEGYNYELECGGTLGGNVYAGFSQFVYINRQKTIFLYLDNFVMWIMQLLGFAQDTNTLISGHATIADIRMTYGSTSQITTFLTYADGVVNVNASCYLDVWYPNGTQFIDAQIMTATGVDGRYVYSISSPLDVGLFSSRSFCNGTALQNRTQYAYGTIDVIDSIYMEVIS